MKSKYHGVFWHKVQKKWIAILIVESKRKQLGSFLTEDGAARAYNKAAYKRLGDSAKLNII